jgi:hypothetical protein
MIKTHTPRGERFEPGWEVLRQIVARRLNVENLVEPDALDMAIEKTGGVLRDLLWVIRQATLVAELGGEERISRRAMRHSLDELKKRYFQSVRGKGEVETIALYERMKAIAKAPLGRMPVDETMQLLLYTRAVIEYNNIGWYDLHPLMRETLREMGYVDDMAR